MPRHEYNLGLIGNCNYNALIDDRANVRWMCWPRFDSSFIFGDLLDDEKGGHFYIHPENGKFDTQQQYLPNTAVLDTSFEREDDIFKVIDFAPRYYQFERFFKPLMLVRKILPMKGSPRIKVCCKPSGDYGKILPTTSMGSNHITFRGLEDQVRLTTNIPINFIMEEKAFVLNEPKYLILTYGEPLEAPLESTADKFLNKTIGYWRNWVKNTYVEQFAQPEVIRSAITLKLHQYEDTGAITASSTTSLPESPGSGRNWDYRYCWLRDSHYTLKALNDLSHFSELERYSEYIENIVLTEEGRYRPLYPISLGKSIKEKMLDLKGYLGNQPVRIGNQAQEHIQNDAYGQVLVTLLPFFTDARLNHSSKKFMQKMVMKILEAIDKRMDEKDNGLWEFREEQQHHCFTYLFHWAGAHAACKIAQKIGDVEMHELGDKLIREASEYIEKCYDNDRKVYCQSIESKHLDASLLQLINMGYLDPDGERAHEHLKALEKVLLSENGLFYRYRHEDDFGKPESTFLVCAFWYAEALARVDRVGEAEEIFNNLCNYSNHLGLHSEDVAPEDGSQWGNFPQTYSHVGLINAAFAISRKQDRPIFK